MKYHEIIEGKFVNRPNRFIAHVEVGAKVLTCHVKNTGRCKELLVPGARVLLEHSSNPSRKTAYSLVAVWKGDRLINMDSQAPNQVVKEWLWEKEFFGPNARIHPEKKFHQSRFDFYIEAQNRKIYMEVKGVTLEENQILRFPDAPTERGIRHLEELAEAILEGYEAYVLFVIQMRGAKYFTPNRQGQEEFARALEDAHRAGVQILAYDCNVTENSLEIREEVEVILDDRI